MNSCIHLLNAARQPSRNIIKKIWQPHTPLVAPYGKCTQKKKKALIFLAPGFEEIELSTPVDVLRRGGIEVIIGGMEGKNKLAGANCMKVTPDKDLDDICGPFDAILMTGDEKAMNAMCKCKRVTKHLKEQEKSCKIIAAICAAPMVLLKNKIGKCMKLTSHPEYEEKLKKFYKYKCADVVVDNYLITARGPAQAMQWSLTILMHLTDEYNACCIAKALLVK